MWMYDVVHDVMYLKLSTKKRTKTLTTFLVTVGAPGKHPA
jgi:hypothetical protein